MLRILIFCFSSFVLTCLAHAQGSALDYERASSLQKNTRNKVINESIVPMWLGPHRFAYRKHITLSSWEFFLVDAKSGMRKLAFDPEQVAKKLASELGQEVDPDKLPIDEISEEGKALLLWLSSGQIIRVNEDASIQFIKSPEEVNSFSSLQLEPTNGTRSRDNGGETEILFRNKSDAALDLFWLDRQGRSKRYSRLNAGEQHKQHTFAGHLWQLQTLEGHVIAHYRAAPRGLSIVVIRSIEKAKLKKVAKKSKANPLRARSNLISPDGKKRIEIRNHNAVLHKDAKEFKLTKDGDSNDSYTKQVYWSPDSRNVVVFKNRFGQRRTVHLIESSPRDQIQPKHESFNYLKPGDRIDHARPRLFNATSCTIIPLDESLFDNPWSMDYRHWNAEGTEFRFLYNQRGHQKLRLLAINSKSGEVRSIIDESSDTFIHYSGKSFLSQHGNDLVWMSERSGWNHLYLYDAEAGEVKNAITSGAWLVDKVVDVDRKKQQILFTAKGVFPKQDPYFVHYGRVNFDGSGLTWLTRANGTHKISLSPNGEYYVDSYSRVDLAPVNELRESKSGSLICELARADWAPLLETGWRPPEPFFTKGRDGKTDIWGVLFYPSNFAPNKTYPVIENIYAGPHGHFVPKAFRTWHSSRKISELGFIVVRIDGMGTSGRSKAFHDICWKNLGDSGFEDRKIWIKAAAKKYEFLDLKRVGIYGGSAGGQSSTRALLAHGDFYHAAVSDCGCHDNRMDKIWWNEQWMGWPVGDHYAQQSNVTNAGKLKGKLLLIVGELDRNVDPASTMQVVAALIRADKDFDLLVMPGYGHGAGGSTYGERRTQDFFVRHLMGREPRWKAADTKK